MPSAVAERRRPLSTACGDVAGRLLDQTMAIDEQDKAMKQRG